MPQCSSEGKREREVYRYYQPLGNLPSASAANISTFNRRGREVQASTDAVLTAFTQLGVHRLQGKRGLISLSTRDTEYILAESSSSLSLQQDNDKKDPLWHGAVALKDNCSLGLDLVRMFSGPEETAPKYLSFDDLSQHEVFKTKLVVTDGPRIRGLSCVPLRSSLHPMVIGVYMVVDDEPRKGISDDEIGFLIDMGVTVMDHLDSIRLNQKQHRAERMVKAIGLFVEGKSTLRDWWLLEGGHNYANSKVKKQSRNNTTLHSQADVEFGIQDPKSDDIHLPRHRELLNKIDRPTLSRSPSSSSMSHVDREREHNGDGRPMLTTGDSNNSNTDTTTPTNVFSKGHIPRNSSVTTFDTSEGTVPDTIRHISVAFDLPSDSPNTEVSKELQEALLTRDVRAVFSRASNLIREAGGVDGTIFYDASLGTFGAASSKDAMEEKAPGTFDMDEPSTTSEDEQPRKASEADDQAAKYCNIIGFSTRQRSSLRGHSAAPEHRPLPEKVLRTLLKRYPHGKVFNFDEDGSFSASDSDKFYMKGDDSGPQRLETVERQMHNQRKRISREEEAAALQQALPGARSVFWFPIWDQTRQKWYAGSLIWTTNPMRILCALEDLAYLAAFGNSIMAEVSRLSALVLTQVKNDFISSISHELRSPLHGVLASVEFLQETDLTELQADMIQNINASGRVLLDTINHILDFTKVNKMVKTKNILSTKKKGKKQRLSFKEDQNTDSLDNSAEDASDVCVISEEVVESMHAGRSMHNSRTDGMRRIVHKPGEDPITIIMDIKYRSNWTYKIDSGAWRRILLNLFGNSLKYTSKGFVKVSLDVDQESTLRGKKTKSVLVLMVKDSGKGISKGFLKNHLFKPFTQEDSLAVGAGLGLSIVRHIVQDLGGDINVSSEPGVGTEVTVRLPLNASSAQARGLLDFLDDILPLSKGRMFSLIGFDRYPDISEAPTGILSADVEGAMLLKSSMHTMLTDWFGLQPATPCGNSEKSKIDVVFVMEAGFANLHDKLVSCSQQPSDSRAPLAIVLCSTWPPVMTAKSYGTLEVMYVPQPYGPHKFARALHQAFTSKETPESVIPVNNESYVPNTPNKYPSLQSQTTPRPHLSRTQDSGYEYLSPASENPTPLSPGPPTSFLGPPDFDRQISIDTSIIQGDGLRVLLVEDNEINLKLLVAYMRKLKLRHETAVNGLEALNIYKEAKGCFDIVFMDISMPIMDGIESTRHIRRFEREQGLDPVSLIALTGAANPNTRQEAFSSGVDLFLTKPVPMKSLKVMLDELKESRCGGLTT
ncbi:hypothetical protein BJ878DRAFT_338818 [Calycina marina]|uniref:histidine kinase n=1 Tax=Calycina marina TaxID=1763456 RepID=A0A9P8CGG5_9HELO|nr:hypothetical protein BJ878DRAFT_338818 [Calycina marina]